MSISILLRLFFVKNLIIERNLYPVFNKALLGFAGPESMFMYDPMTFGTPLTLLQIPQQAIRDVQSQVETADCTLTYYTQDCKSRSDLKHVISQSDLAMVRDSFLDVGFICKKCHMVYPGKEACLNHQHNMCYQTDKATVDKGKTMLKLEQLQYNCAACKAKHSTQQEFKTHCDSDNHKRRGQAWLQSRQTEPGAGNQDNSHKDGDSTSVNRATPTPGQNPAATDHS